MNFYKTVCIVTVVILLISLALIGSTLVNSSTDVQFPPNISKCPDNYVTNYDNDGKFVSCTSTNSDSGAMEKEDFSELKYNIPGIGKTSGACKKKKWAIQRNVDWDGLTNNSIICHSTNL